MDKLLEQENTIIIQNYKPNKDNNCHAKFTAVFLRQLRAQTLMIQKKKMLQCSVWKVLSIRKWVRTPVTCD